MTKNCKNCGIYGVEETYCNKCEYQRRKNKWEKENLCSKCGVNLREEGFVICINCREYHKKWRAERKEKPLKKCINCDNLQVRHDQALCRSCLLAKKKNIVCTNCNKNHAALDTSGNTCCKDCLAKLRVDKRNKARENGFCTLCFIRPKREGILFCVDCAEKSTKDAGLARKESRAKYVKLLGQKCVNCNLEHEDPIMFEFDHINPSEKEFNISRMINWSEQKVLKELEKCQLLCLYCHKKKHRIY